MKRVFRAVPDDPRRTEDVRLLRASRKRCRFPARGPGVGRPTRRAPKMRQVDTTYSPNKIQ